MQFLAYHTVGWMRVDLDSLSGMSRTADALQVEKQDRADDVLSNRITMPFVNKVS